MEVLQMSKADNGKQEIERIISMVVSFSFRKLLPSEIRETKQAMRFPLDLYYMDTRLFTPSLQEQRLRLRQRLVVSHDPGLSNHE
jgi:hypothetical protein